MALWGVIIHKQILNVHNLYTKFHSKCFGYSGEQDRCCENILQGMA